MATTRNVADHQTTVPFEAVVTKKHIYFIHFATRTKQNDKMEDSSD